MSICALLAVLFVGCPHSRTDALPDVAPLDPEGAQRAYEQGNVALSNQNYGLAVQHFSQAIELNPNLLAAYNNRAIAQSNSGRPDLAVEDLNRAIAAASDSRERTTYLFNLGNVHLARGALGLAARSFEQALELDPLDLQTRNNLALAYLRLGEVEQAETMLLDVVREDPDNVSALANLGTLYDDRGDFSRALDYYRRTLDINPEHWETLRNTGMLELRQGRRRRAIEHLRAFVDLAPAETDTARERSTLERLLERN